MTVKDRIGTLEGVLTVRVDSRNPKTADGFNTFIFRRPAEESLRLLAATPIIDAVGNPLPEGIVVGDKSVRYTPEEKKALIRFVVERAKEQYGPDQHVVAKLRADSEIALLRELSRIVGSAREKSKADSEVTSLQGQTRIGEPAFDAVYDNRFRLILQGVAAYFDSCQEGRLRLSQELRLGKLSGEAHGWIFQSEIEQHFNVKYDRGNI